MCDKSVTKMVCGKFVCRRRRRWRRRRGGEEEEQEPGATDPKTRTLHNDVGKNDGQLLDVWGMRVVF